MESEDEVVYTENFTFQYLWTINNFQEKKVEDAKLTFEKNTNNKWYAVSSKKFETHNGNYFWFLRFVCEEEIGEYNGPPTTFRYIIDVECHDLMNCCRDIIVEIKVDNICDAVDAKVCVNPKDNNHKSVLLFDDLYFTHRVKDVTIIFTITESFVPAVHVPEMFNLSCDYEKLLRTGYNSDCKIIIGEMEYPVHKIILSTRSEYFSLLFKYESNEQAHNELEITDVSPDVMTVILQFIYCAKFNIAKDLLYDILTAADKYQIKDLKKKCEESLVNNLKINNVGECMVYAEKYNNSYLKVGTANFLLKCASEFSEDDIKLLKSNLILISSPFVTSLVARLLFENEAINGLP